MLPRALLPQFLQVIPQILEACLLGNLFVHLISLMLMPQMSLSTSKLQQMVAEAFSTQIMTVYSV